MVRLDPIIQGGCALLPQGHGTNRKIGMTLALRIPAPPVKSGGPPERFLIRHGPFLIAPLLNATVISIEYEDPCAKISRMSATKCHCEQAESLISPLFRLTEN